MPGPSKPVLPWYKGTRVKQHKKYLEDKKANQEVPTNSILWQAPKLLVTPI